jgi:hypothetical protein
VLNANDEMAHGLGARREMEAIEDYRGAHSDSDRGNRFVPAPQPERARWEQIWSHRLATTRQILAIAAAHLRGTIDRADKEEWESDVDGIRALRRARKAERLATENYLIVLRIYTDLVVNGRLPQ